MYVGGIVGTTTGGLEECKSLGKISTCSTDTVISGGIAGYSSSTLRNSFSTIELNCSNASEDMFIGGLLGQCTKLMNESYFNGIIQIENSYTSSNICVGGLVGYMNYDGKITNSFSDSAISINCNNTVSIGAIVGMIYEGTIENVFMVKTHDYKINNISCEYNNDFNDYGMVENCSNLNLLYTRCLNSWDDSVWDVKENEYPHLR